MPAVLSYYLLLIGSYHYKLNAEISWTILPKMVIRTPQDFDNTDKITKFNARREESKTKSGKFNTTCMHFKITEYNYEHQQVENPVHMTRAHDV